MGQRSIQKQVNVDFVGRKVFVMKLVIFALNVDLIIAIVQMKREIALLNM